MKKRLTTEEIAAIAPVIPVIIIERAEWAAPLAKALMAGGINTAEITLRTPAALEAISAMAKAAPDFVVGVGTVLNGADLKAAAEAGARYALSPGTTQALFAAGADGPIPLIPGIATPSEIALGLEHGYRCFKFYPAEQLGGPEAIKVVGGPYPNVVFCPTGSIAPERVPAYLALKNVGCVGGSWVAPAEMLRAGDWVGIEANARRAASFRK